MQDHLAARNPSGKPDPEMAMRALGRQVGLMKRELARLRRGLEILAQRAEPW